MKKHYQRLLQNSHKNLPWNSPKSDIKIIQNSVKFGQKWEFKHNINPAKTHQNLPLQETRSSSKNTPKRVDVKWGIRSNFDEVFPASFLSQSKVSFHSCSFSNIDCRCAYILSLNILRSFFLFFILLRVQVSLLFSWVLISHLQSFVCYCTV